ncbi:MAG: DEAD/DEAH box helicase, partial [Fimbriimonadaceae bacterium]|nr:DEAD/DEAH box helicase [Fimbriimonadaceae bacterium]
MLPNTIDRPSFACLKLSDALLSQLSRLSFTVPTPIQLQAITPAIEGCDIVGIAQTGTGKTFAFGLPMLDRLLGSTDVGLILAPTRELALQIDESLRKLAGPLGLRTAVLIGGAPMNRQISDLRRRPNIIVATPGRLKDHLYQRTMHLKNVTVVVLDEADRMLDMGFAPAVKAILDQTPEKRQTMLFSATMPPEVNDLARHYLTEPVRIEVSPQGTASELVEQEMHVVEHAKKGDLLANVLDAYRGTVLVFSRTRHGARKVARAIRDMGHSAAELHSDRTLAQRRAALDGFKSGQHRILVATDIAARGIDVKEIELVLNYDMPDQLEDYVHRIGRTGRAGSPGQAISFLLPDQQKDVRKIERILGREVRVVKRGTHGEGRAFEKAGTSVREESTAVDLDRTEMPAIVEAPRERPASRVQEERPRPSNRDRRPTTMNRDERPRFESRDRARTPQNRNDRPRFDGRDGDRPAQKREERPRWNHRDDSRPWQTRDKGPREDNRDNPQSPQNREERPRFDNRENGRPPQNRDQRPMPKNRDAKPRWDKRDGRPSKTPKSPTGKPSANPTG